MSRPGNFDKDLNLQGWFDETLADAPRGFFDKDAIGKSESDVQSAHGGDAAAAPAAAPAAKTTRAHDRPLEWWSQAAEASWFADLERHLKKPANDQAKDETDESRPSAEDLAAWWNGKDAKVEGDAKRWRAENDVYVHALPLDSRDDNVYVLPLRSFENAPEEPLDYMKLGALERAAGFDARYDATTLAMTSGWVSLHPITRVAISSLIVLGAWHLLKTLSDAGEGSGEEPASARRSEKRPLKKTSAKKSMKTIRSRKR